MQLQLAASGNEFANFQRSLVYDLAMRLPLLGWSVFAATLQMAGFIRYLREADPPLSYSIYAIEMVMRLSTSGFLLLLAAAVILRARPTGKAAGLEPRISAFTGTFLVYAIPLCPRRELSLCTELVSTLLTFVGSVGAIVALSQLGRSFSLMAEARRLVTSGPYRFVRHPLYLAEELAVLGLFLQFACYWAIVFLAVQIAFQLRRMHNEEAVLTASFPEYAAYRERTARLIPGVY
jgi:protein-S-isoprenylcysteine O-methyltransferase Ste14